MIKVLKNIEPLSWFSVLWLLMVSKVIFFSNLFIFTTYGTCIKKKGKRRVQGVPQSQTAALPRHQKEEETDKSKHAQTEQTYEKH